MNETIHFGFKLIASITIQNGLVVKSTEAKPHKLIYRRVDLGWHQFQTQSFVQTSNR